MQRKKADRLACTHYAAWSDHWSVPRKSSMANATRSRFSLTPWSCNHSAHCCNVSLPHDQPESKSTHASPEGMNGIAASAMLACSADALSTCACNKKREVGTCARSRHPFATELHMRAMCDFIFFSENSVSTVCRNKRRTGGHQALSITTTSGAGGRCAVTARDDQACAS